MTVSALSILQTIYGYPEFRGQQEAIICQLAGGGEAHATNRSAPSELTQRRLAFRLLHMRQVCSAIALYKRRRQSSALLGSERVS